MKYVAALLQGKLAVGWVMANAKNAIAAISIIDAMILDFFWNDMIIRPCSL
jgi:hypothetical protein